MEQDTRIPIMLVSGYLGSGKTTILRSLLSQSPFQRSAVIVNEFGEVGIDHHLLRRAEERVTLLAHGCLCCGRREDLVETLRELLSQRSRGLTAAFDRVLIETTGLADPVPVVSTIVTDPVLKYHFRLDRILVTVDAVNGLSSFANAPEWTKQVATADVLVMTKLDLAGVDEHRSLAVALRRLNPLASVIAANRGCIDVSTLLHSKVPSHTLNASFPREREQDAADHEEAGWDRSRHAGMRTRCMTLSGPIDWQVFGLWLTMLLHRHGSELVRIKGLINVDNRDGPLLLEGVQHIVHLPRHLPTWPDTDRRSRIVVIGRDIDLSRVEASLLAFQQLGSNDRQRL